MITSLYYIYFFFSVFLFNHFLLLKPDFSAIREHDQTGDKKANRAIPHPGYGAVRFDHFIF